MGYLPSRKHNHVMNRIAVRSAVETVSYPPRTTRAISRGKHISLGKNHEVERTEMGKSTIRRLWRNSTFSHENALSNPPSCIRHIWRIRPISTKLCASISDSEAKTCERIEMITPGTLHLRKPRSHRRDTWVSLRPKYPHDSRTRQVAYSSPANPGNRSPGISSELRSLETTVLGGKINNKN